MILFMGLSEPSSVTGAHGTCFRAPVMRISGDLTSLLTIKGYYAFLQLKV